MVYPECDRLLPQIRDYVELTQYSTNITGLRYTCECKFTFTIGHDEETSPYRLISTFEDVNYVCSIDDMHSYRDGFMVNGYSSNNPDQFTITIVFLDTF